MDVFKSKIKKIPRTHSDKEVVKIARRLFHAIESSSKRSAYLRSPYFDKDKVFINSFWDHLYQKSSSDRKRRLQFLPCAFDLIEHCRIQPTTKSNPKDRGELLHRFTGEVEGGEQFIVQIKEDVRTGRKDFMSVFPKE
jgi:hypothetical protein